VPTSNHGSAAPSCTTDDVIEKLIAGNEAAVLAWDRAVRGEHGGVRNPSGINQHTKSSTPVNKVKPDNVLLEVKPRKSATTDYGNSADAGLRRLARTHPDILSAYERGETAGWLSRAGEGAS
jgi:hypothetical protein